MQTILISGICFLAGIILIVLIIPTKKRRKGDKREKKDFFTLSAEGKRLIFRDPFDNFLIYAGANSGKTKSIGKPILKEYLRTNFAGFVYDYKDDDLSKTVYHFHQKFAVKYPLYHISFTEPSKSHRTNPISPKLITDENLFIQVIDDFYAAYADNDRPDEWYKGAVGILRGIAINFYYLYPDFCTIPHIVQFTCSAGAKRITEFLKRTQRSRALASGFIDAQDSPKTQSSFLSSLTNPLSILTLNKNIAWVLTGDDFDFNLIDPQNPKILTISNSFQKENVIGPVISLMLTVSTRQFTLSNQVEFFYFLDEATTFKIVDFEKLPSVLREYKCSFTFITQSGSKVERRYSKLERSSIEANFGNQFYGKTTDVEALKNYPLVFGKAENRKISRTSGSSSGRVSESKTVSTLKEERYDSNFFTRLTAGEFVGIAANANLRDFHLYFDLYDSKKEGETDLPTVRAVIPQDVEKNYDKIISDVETI
ncbi:MAG: type IV secretory system conjugative DNA transfer family protein [Bacteroidales bacterium]|jgi:hypothetical protein|nr:type IV secretory system conjugative DNA transfer family protein [Bacteroidales bacterium]